MKISFCLITLNEEDNLPRCLKSCADLADEILIVDSGSKDRTEQIARKFGARWKHQDWLGYVGQKNKVISLANHEWIFSIDADEELSPELRDEIKLFRSVEPAEDRSAFSVRRCVCYEGRWIRHGVWYPDRQPRLFRQSRGKFAGGRLDEFLEVSGRVVRLHGELYHYPFRDAADHWKRCQRYARLWAEDKFEQGEVASPLSPWTHAVAHWWRGYVMRRGFLDGGQGWRIAAICAREVFLKYQLLRAMRRDHKS